MKKNEHNIVFFSVLTLALSSLSVVVSGRYRDCGSLLNVLGIAMLPLLPRFSNGEKTRKITVTSSIGVLLGLGTMVLSQFFDVHPQLRTLVLCLSVAVPVSYRIVSAGIDMALDMDFLCGNGLGWESTLYYGNVMVSALSVFLYLALQGVCAAGGGAMDLTGVISVLIMLGAYGFLLLRSITGFGTVSPLDVKGRVREQVSSVLRSGRSRHEISVNYKMLYGRITEYMDEKRPYLNPAFGLDDMAKAMFTNSGYISRMINVCTGSNFSQFVNGYRVRYAMELYRRDTSLKMSELAQLSGFNTKVTFNMAFKLATDETPGQWCKRYLESMQQAKDLSNRKEQHR